MSKNELLLLAEEHFFSFKVVLTHSQDNSKIFLDSGQDITDQYFSFMKLLLRLHGIDTSF